MPRSNETQPPPRIRRGTSGVKSVPSRFRGNAGGVNDASGANSEGQHWERVMHTKLAQWRYMHLVALEELSQSERNACAEIAELGDELEKSTANLHELECILAEAHATRAREHFADRAAPSLALLDLGLASATPAHEEVCTALVDALRRLRTPAGAAGNAEKLPMTLAKFRETADEFVDAAKRANVPDSAAVARSLLQLERVAVNMQQDALAAAAKEIADAGDAIDEEREKRATMVIEGEEKERDGRPLAGKSTSSRVRSPGEKALPVA